APPRRVVRRSRLSFELQRNGPFGPILLMRGGRFIHGGGAETKEAGSPELEAALGRPAWGFLLDCATHSAHVKPPFRSSMRVVLTTIAPLVVLLAKHGWQTT